jgi:hypothetical protein
MRKLVIAIAAAALVVALGAPAYADSGRNSTSSGHFTTLDHHGYRHDGYRHGDHDGYRHDGYRHGGYYRHHGYYGYRDYDGYYDGYDGSGRCDWAYYHDRYWFDRYCGGYYYGYSTDANPAPDQMTPAPDQNAPVPDQSQPAAENPQPQDQAPVATVATQPDPPGQGVSHYDALHHDTTPK